MGDCMCSCEINWYNDDDGRAVIQYVSIGGKKHYMGQIVLRVVPDVIRPGDYINHYGRPTKAVTQIKVLSVTNDMVLAVIKRPLDRRTTC